MEIQVRRYKAESDSRELVDRKCHECRKQGRERNSPISDSSVAPLPCQDGRTI